MISDVVVIGAGAVGLAVAARLSAAGNNTIVLEKAAAIGTGASSRNSEVIHAGLYYPTGSLKRRLCVAGRRQLYEWMDTRKVAYKKTGKLVVATNKAECAAIEALYEQGRRNGVEGLELISSDTANSLEPDLSCELALLSPETGILDTHGYMLSLQGALEDQGGAIAFNTPAICIKPLKDGQLRVQTGGNDPALITSRRVINCAGLYAHQVAQSVESHRPAQLPDVTYAKGSYFACQAKPAFSRLIYPAPVDGGLGIHVTLDLNGRMRLGPDVEWLEQTDPDQIDYAVDIQRATGFCTSARKYWPAMPDNCIAPDYAGVRAKLSSQGEPPADFRIDGPNDHGIEGLVNLFGIESPGLTSSLAIGAEIMSMLDA